MACIPNFSKIDANSDYSGPPLFIYKPSFRVQMKYPELVAITRPLNKSHIAVVNGKKENSQRHENEDIHLTLDDAFLETSFKFITSKVPWDNKTRHINATAPVSRRIQSKS